MIGLGREENGLGGAGMASDLRAFVLAMPSVWKDTGVSPAAHSLHLSIC